MKSYEFKEFINILEKKYTLQSNARRRDFINTDEFIQYIFDDISLDAIRIMNKCNGERYSIYFYRNKISEGLKSSLRFWSHDKALDQLIKQLTP